MLQVWIFITIVISFTIVYANAKRHLLDRQRRIPLSDHPKCKSPPFTAKINQKVNLSTVFRI